MSTTKAAVIEYCGPIDAPVMAFDYGHGWRPAVIEKRDDYKTRACVHKGFYIRWTDLPERQNRDDPMPSTGGWVPATSVKGIDQ